MQINPQTQITMLDPEFVSVLNNLLKNTLPDPSDIIAVNFRDPNYSAEKGGYHPVEVHVNAKGEVLCISDFVYVGTRPMFDLSIELDWNFEQNSFRQYDSFYDLDCGRSLLGLYTRNFTAYYNSGVYQVEVTTL